MRRMLLAHLFTNCVAVTLAGCATDTTHQPGEVQHAVNSSHETESLFAPEVVTQLSPDDRQRMAASLQAAMYAERGKTFEWQDSSTGYGGSAVALRRGYNPGSGHICAELRQTLALRKQVLTETGYACRQPNGSWVLEPEMKGNRRLL